jgi:chromosomal replication initiation ATPase DnaA
MNRPKEKTRIKVFVRCRPPPSSNEFEEELNNCVEMNTADNTIRVKRTTFHHKAFRFDRVFDIADTQETIFKHVAQGAIDDAFKGYHGTIFVYGQTGTGKTYTYVVVF